MMGLGSTLVELMAPRLMYFQTSAVDKEFIYQYQGEGYGRQRNIAEIRCEFSVVLVIDHHHGFNSQIPKLTNRWY